LPSSDLNILVYDFLFFDSKHLPFHLLMKLFLALLLFCVKYWLDVLNPGCSLGPLAETGGQQLVGFNMIDFMDRSR
jgi:hypothetical protein